MDSRKLMVLGRLIAELGEIAGRTRLQKMVHLLGEKFPHDFRRRFTLHYFGPFSRKLADDVSFMVAANIITEQEPSETAENSYRYKVTCEAARKRIDAATGSSSPDWLEFAAQLNKLDKATLEAVSTVVFLRKQPSNTDDILRGDFERLKPHLTHKFDEAFLFAKAHF